MEERTCARPDCGAAFRSARGFQKYCTERCQKIVGSRRHSSKMPAIGEHLPGRGEEILTCEACGSTFDNSIRRNTTSTRFCSSRCFEWTRTHPGEKRPDGHGCEACGAAVRRPQAKTCGARRCLAWVKRHPGERIPEARTCGGCGAELTGHISQRFCDYNCSWWARTHPGVLRPSVRTCRTCGADLAGRGSRAIYCSGDCYYRHEDQLAKARASAKKRRALIDGGASLPFSDQQLADRMSMFGNKCYICHVPANSVDHVKPVRAGGMHGLANFRPICKSCNSRKGEVWPLPMALILLSGTPRERLVLLRDARRDARLWSGTRKAKRAAETPCRDAMALGAMPELTA